MLLDRSSCARRTRFTCGNAAAGRLFVAVAVCVAAAASARAQVGPAPSAPLQIKRDLRADLTELSRRADGVRTALRTGGPADVAGVVAAIDQVRADVLLLGGVDDEIERQLAGGATAIQRHRTAAATLRQRLDALRVHLDGVATAVDAGDRGPLQTALDALVGMLADAVPPPDRTPLGLSLPYRSLNLPAVAPVLQPSVVPAYLDNRPRPSVDADLAAG